MAHYPTNRGRLLVVTDLNANPTTYSIGLCNAASVPAGITQSGVNDLNFVADLLAVSGVAELAVGGYARTALATYTATQDNTNDRVNIDFDNVAFGALAAGGNIWGGFVFKNTGANDAARQLVSVFTHSVIPTNGSSFTENISDLLRLQ